MSCPSNSSSSYVPPVSVHESSAFGQDAAREQKRLKNLEQLAMARRKAAEKKKLDKQKVQSFERLEKLEENLEDDLKHEVEDLEKERQEYEIFKKGKVVVHPPVIVTRKRKQKKADSEDEEEEDDSKKSSKKPNLWVEAARVAVVGALSLGSFYVSNMWKKQDAAVVPPAPSVAQPQPAAQPAVSFSSYSMYPPVVPRRMPDKSGFVP